jgi:hypothetical protein
VLQLISEKGYGSLNEIYLISLLRSVSRREESNEGVVIFQGTFLFWIIELSPLFVKIY